MIKFTGDQVTVPKWLCDTILNLLWELVLRWQFDTKKGFCFLWDTVLGHQNDTKMNVFVKTSLGLSQDTMLGTYGKRDDLKTSVSGQ